MHKNILVCVGITMLFLGTCINQTVATKTSEQSSIILSNNNNLYDFGSGIPPVANFTIHNNTLNGYVWFDGSFSYDSDGEIISYDWDFGDGETGSGKYVDHQYCTSGSFDITLTVTDNDGLEGNLTKSVEVSLANYPPPSANIDGSTSGTVGIEYFYEFWATHPEDYPIFFSIDWGDGNSTGWIGPYPTNYHVTLSSSWSKTGIYIIKLEVKDYCNKGDQTSLLVTIPRNRASDIVWLHWFLECFPMLERLLNILR